VIVSFFEPPFGPAPKYEPQPEPKMPIWWDDDSKYPRLQGHWNRSHLPVGSGNGLASEVVCVEEYRDYAERATGRSDDQL
jgi:hypothetical protein